MTGMVCPNIIILSEQLVAAKRAARSRCIRVAQVNLCLGCLEGNWVNAAVYLYERCDWLM